MRVTQNTMTQSLMRYLTAQNEALYDRQRIIATQKRINKPSDDPIGMGKILDYRQTLESIDQYQTNIQTGMTRLDVTESTLKLVDDLLQVVRAIGQTEAAGTAESRLLAAEEVKRLYDQIMDLSNSTQNDNYLFSGYLTKTAPFSRDDTQLTTYDKYTASYNGDNGDVNFIVATNTEVSIDADGQPIFHDAASGGINIFDHIRDLIVGLENDDSDAISTQSGMLDQGRTQINNIRAANSSIYYQLEITERHWQTYKPKIQDLMAKEEEADITKAVVELQNIELAYQTTLATAARVIQPGLVQFLK
ncbi:MAG: flagellar hook-associated protein FlgL [Desulfobacterales bacterium]|nr:flagellar hook-associated protein FlgL [Desulfobacterales bacterium]